MGCFLNCRKDLINEQGLKIDFLCPECGEISPEISNINVDQKYVEFKCKICAEKGYYSEFFYKDGLRYSCKPKPSEASQEKFLFKESENKSEESEYIKKSSTKNINKDELNESKEMIKLKNEQLKKLIMFNQIILKASEQSQYNYYHLKSIKNILKSLKKEKGRDSNDLKFILTAFNYDIKIAEDAIKKVDDFLGKNEKIERQLERLLLNGKNLKDEYIEYISQIKFNQLKEINLSGNGITNIEPLCNMNLPFLEFLNLSNNQIIDIKPLKEINSKKFNYLFIQNNQIEDIKVLLDGDFPIFEILRLENNDKIKDKDNSKKDLIELIKLYTNHKKILIINNDDIKKYNIDYKEDMKEIEVSNEKDGDLVLKYLFINIPSNNKIKKLTLIENKIQDPSILNRIQFDFLEELNLGYNNIKNLNFLKGMKAKSLNKLYLEKNDFNDLSVLYNIKKFFNKIKEIYLDEDSFNPNDSKFMHLKQTLKNEKIDLNLIKIILNN